MGVCSGVCNFCFVCVRDHTLVIADFVVYLDGRIGGRRFPDESLLAQILVNGLCELVANAGNCAQCVGARAEVRNLSKVFERVALRGCGIRFRLVDPADNLDTGRVNFDALALSLKLHHLAFNNYCTSYNKIQNLFEIIQ